MTHREFCSQDKKFRLACERSKTEPTVRQASKWRNSAGKAYAWYVRLSKQEAGVFNGELNS